MKEIMNVNNSIVVKDLMGEFLNYIDVSERTVRTYKVGLMDFTKWLSENNITQPTRTHIIEYREQLRETHKPTTVNSYLQAVRNFYSWLEYEGVTKNITKNVKGIKMERRHLRQGLSKEQVELLLSVVDGLREEVLLKLMLTTALRVNEISNIQLEDFYEDNGVVMLKVLGKGRDGIKQDVVKIDDRLYELILKYVNNYGLTDYLFTSTSNHNTGNKVHNATIRRIINAIYERAGIKNDKITAHSTRKTAINRAIENGVAIQDVSDFARHGDISTTMMYLNEYNAKESKVSNNLADDLF